MQSTGQTSTQAVSFTPTQGSMMMCVTYALLSRAALVCRGRGSTRRAKILTDLGPGSRNLGEGPVEGVERPGDRLAVVREGEETGLVGRRRQVDAVREQAVEDAGEEPAIG